MKYFFHGDCSEMRNFLLVLMDSLLNYFQVAVKGMYLPDSFLLYFN